VEVFSNIAAKKRTERRVRELENLAFQDSLTEIPNRLYAELKVEHALQEVEHFDRRNALLLLDLDHFKQVNDTYGHAMGDNLLRTVCRTISVNLRMGNMVARWGGDEFLLIVKDVSEDGLRQYGERLLRLIANSVVAEGSTRFTVTASIGCTMIRKEDTSQSALQRADSLMYRSKAFGGNAAICG
jgi:diguanylate cyclase (GGDEF)-like protein